MANDIEQNFTQTYGERLIFLAEKELDALPVCNNGNQIKKVFQYFCKIYLKTHFCYSEFLRLLLVCIFIMPEIRKIRKNTLEEKVHQLVIFVSVCNLNLTQQTHKLISSDLSRKTATSKNWSPFAQSRIIRILHLIRTWLVWER